MSFSINTNIASLQAQDYIRVNSEFQSKTINRVTSGLRIVSSGDDAAGLAIANNLRSDQAVLTQGIRNANDGLSQLQIVDGGMNNISKLLDRARTLATQSASGTFTGSRSVLNSEFQSVIQEIDRQATAVGLNVGGQFAKSLAVFVGGGRGVGSAAITNGSVSVDLSNSTVDAKSLGLKGVSASGIDSVDIGTGSAATSVSAIVTNSTNQGSLATAGFTDLYFKGPGFGDSNRVKVSVNLSSVTDADTLATAVNAAISAAGTSGSQAATAFKNAGITASVGVTSTGTKFLQFTSSNTAFQVEAGDRMSNALLGNVTSNSDPTGLSLTNTVTGAAATAAAATTFGASGAGTVTVRFTGSNLSSPVDISLNVASGTTVAQALTSLTSAVAGNSALQAAGISVQTATAGGALVFQNARGERFDVQASGDVNNNLGLGSFRSSAGTSGTFDYTSVAGSGGAFSGAGQTLQFSVGGGATQSVTLAASDTASATAAATALNAAFAQNSNLSAAQLTASVSGGQLTITSGNNSLFRLNTVGTDDVGFGGSATGVSFTSNAQAGNTNVNFFASGGAQQTGILAFSAIRNASDTQTLTITANDNAGATQSLAVKLENDSTARTGASVDEAVDQINKQLQQSNNTTLQQIVAVKDKASAGGAEGIRFISNLTSFKVGVGTTGSGAGVGNQNSVQNSSTVGSGSTADISSQSTAQNAVTALANAVSTLGTSQAVVGKGQNNFSYAVNLAQSQLSNLAASESRIRDADLAAEAANLTKAQITLQAGIAALAQANSAPQAILSLLRG